MFPSLQWSIHLSFNGNCAAAMACYQQCFGGELKIQPLPDPVAAALPGKISKVIEARLQLPGFAIYGSDLIDETGGFVTSKTQLSFETEDKNFIQQTYKILTGSSDIDVINGRLAFTDTFGISWLMTLQTQNRK